MNVAFFVIGLLLGNSNRRAVKYKKRQNNLAETRISCLSNTVFHTLRGSLFINILISATRRYVAYAVDCAS